MSQNVQSENEYAHAIYYFSGTGNSLFAAKTIAAGLPECQLVSIPTVRKTAEVVPAQSIGLIFPLYYFGLPGLVSEWIEKLECPSAEYFYAIVTCGFPHLSTALHQVNELLSRKGKRLNAGFHLQMISNYIPLSDLPPQKTRDKILDRAERKLRTISQTVLAAQSTVEKEWFHLPCRMVYRHWRTSNNPKSAGKFSCSACSACGICTKVCPVGNIQLQHGTPLWQENCQECLACLHACPTQGIDFGPKSEGRSRYRHPQIMLSEIIESNNTSQ